MTERIDHADMVARVALARDGWLVPGKYLVQSFEDAQTLNRIADELVAERDELREKLAAARAKLDAVTDERDELQTQVTVLKFDNGELSRAQRRISKLQAKIAEIES